MKELSRIILRTLAALVGVGLITWVGFAAIPVNATTIGFAYLLLVLIVASLFGFPEAAVASIAATLAFNYYFLPPIGRLTIADPQNWVALFSFLSTSLIASRLSVHAKRRTADALQRKQDLERLYTFSRAILLIDASEPFPKQLAAKLADIFELDAVVLYDRRADEFYRAGPLDFERMDDQLRDAALLGTTFQDNAQHRVITAIRLGSEPIAGLALQGDSIPNSLPDSVLQGIANLVAIGLERARAQNLSTQIDAAKQSEKLRSALLDAMAHEFKTPLTSVMAATSSLLANPDQSRESQHELLQIADQEARRLRELIDDTVEVGRLDSAKIEVDAEPANVADIVREVVAAMNSDGDPRAIQAEYDEAPAAIAPTIAIDRRLVKLAVKQLLDNAFKYSPATEPIQVRVHNGSGMVTVEVTDHGPGISPQEQERIFDRLYRSPSVERQIPGSGLGLSIAQNIAHAHHGDVTVSSRPGETTFRLTLAANTKANGAEGKQL